MLKIKEPIKKAVKILWKSLPVLLGIILLISLANSLIPKSAYSFLFSKIPLIDSVIGASIGSILAGNPVTSYIFGGELLNQGVSLIAVTTFIVAWVTVGVIQFPAEAILLGKRFAITRNISAFVFAIITAFITVALINTIEVFL